MTTTAQDTILWPLTPGAPAHRLDQPQHVTEAQTWAASILRPLAEQRALEAAAVARRRAER